MTKNAIKVTMTVAVFLLCVAVVSAIDVVFPSSGGAPDAIWTNNSDTIYPAVDNLWTTRSYRFSAGSSTYDALENRTRLQREGLYPGFSSFSIGTFFSPYRNIVGAGNWTYLPAPSGSMGKLDIRGYLVNASIRTDKGGFLEVGRNARILGNATIDDTTYVNDMNVTGDVDMNASTTMSWNCGSGHFVINATGSTAVLQCVS